MTGWGTQNADFEKISSQFDLQVSRKKITGVIRTNVTGRSTGLPSGVSGEFIDIWDGQAPSLNPQGDWVPPTQDRIHDLVSTDAADTLLGTGARTVFVRGISGGLLASEIVEMDGLTNAPTVNAYDSIHRMDVVSSGSGVANAGQITATAQVDDTVTSMMLAGLNKTFQGTFKTPDNFEYYINQVIYSIERGSGAGTDGNFRIVVISQSTGIITASIPIAVSGTGSSSFSVGIKYPFLIPSDSYVKIQVDPTQSSTIADAILFGVLVDMKL